MKKNLCIAETDENGLVACVWVSGPDIRTPRVFDPALHTELVRRADFLGAPTHQITGWIREQQSVALWSDGMTR